MRKKTYPTGAYSFLAPLTQRLVKNTLTKESSLHRCVALKGFLFLLVLLLFAQFIGGSGTAYAQSSTTTHGNMLTFSTHPAIPAAAGCHTSYVRVYYTGGNSYDFYCSGYSYVDLVGVGGVQPQAWSGWLHSKGTTLWWKFCDYTYGLIPNQEIDIEYLSPTKINGC